jgi:hypothetical protein
MKLPAQAPGPARDPTDRRLAAALLESIVYELSHDLGVVEHDAPPYLLVQVEDRPKRPVRTSGRCLIPGRGR